MTLSRLDCTAVCELRQCPWPFSFKHSQCGKRRSRSSSLHTTLASGTKGVCECKIYICEVYLDSYMPASGSWFMVTLDYFQKPPLGGRRNTKPGNHYILNTHNRWFILFYHAWGPTWIEIHGNSIGLRCRSHMASYIYTTREDLWAPSMFLEVCCDGLWTLSFGLSHQFHGHGSLARVWNGPYRRLRRRDACKFLFLIYFGKIDSRVVGRSTACSGKLNVRASGWRLGLAERKR